MIISINVENNFDNRINLTIKKCEHIEFKVKGSSENDFKFCERCGILMSDGKAITIKPEVLNHKIEINPFEIFNNMIENDPITKKENFFYLSENEREEIIDMLKKLIIKYHFSDKSFYKSVILIDIMTSTNFFRKNKNQIKSDLIVLGCLFLSAKYCENDPFLPNLKEIQVLSQSYFYNVKEIIKYEQLCLKVLSHRLDYYTPFDYLQFYLSNGIILTDELNFIKPFTLEKIYQQCHFYMAEFVNDGFYRDFSSIQIASACVYLIREYLKLDDNWDKIFKVCYKIDFEDFRECYEVLKKKNNLTIYRKRSVMISSTSLRKMDLINGNYLPLRQNTICLSTSGDLNANSFLKKVNINPQYEAEKKNINYSKPIIKTQSININKSLAKKEAQQEVQTQSLVNPSEEDIIYEKKYVLRHNNSFKNKIKKDLYESFDVKNINEKDSLIMKNSINLSNEITNAPKTVNSGQNNSAPISEILNIKKAKTDAINFYSNCSTNCNSNSNNLDKQNELENKLDFKNYYLDSFHKYNIPNRTNIMEPKNNSVLKKIDDKTYDLDLKSIYRSELNYKRYVSSSTNNLNKTFYK